MEELAPIINVFALPDIQAIAAKLHGMTNISALTIVVDLYVIPELPVQMHGKVLSLNQLQTVAIL